jgi:nucleotide-binding universal stress UspA family protein
MQHYLVPTDFSATAKGAFQYAFELAKKTQGNITLLNIYTAGEDELQVLAQLESLKKEILESNQVNISIELLALKGKLIDILADLVTKYTYEYIIMGMQGSRSVNLSWLGMKEVESVENFWMGSNTIKILQNIQKPVVIVPRNAAFQPVNQIILAIDTKKEYLSEVFKPLHTLVNTYKSNVTIVTVRLRDEEKDDDNEILQLRKIKKWLGEDVPCSLKIVLADSVQEGLKYYISQEKDKNMLVMMSRKMDFLERMFGISETQQMVYSTTMPLLIIHNV